MWGPKLEKRRKGQKEKIRGGVVERFSGPISRGGVVDEIRKFEGGG